MTDGYLCGAVSQCRVSKRIFFRRNKTHLGPLSLAKLFSFNCYISYFLVFVFAKFLITPSKSTCQAMLDSMFNLARSTNRVCDIADRK